MPERKKKLLVILGAGSSLAQGMPSVAQNRPSAADGPAIPSLNSSMRTWSSEWSAHHHFPNYFEAVWNAVDRYYHSSTRTMNPAHEPQVNYEKVLGEMLGLAHWMEPPPFGNAFRQIASANAAPPELIFPLFDEEHRYGATVAITHQLSYLLQRLARDMRQRCQRIDVTTPAFQMYKKLLCGLHCTFDVGIYNLNYDNVALLALPQAFTGFASDGAFNPGLVHERTEWGFVYQSRQRPPHVRAGIRKLDPLAA